MSRRAVIVAAGVGRRLTPHTADRPKCMVEVGGRAMLDWQLAALRAAGVEDFVVVRGHGADAVARPRLRYATNADYARNNILGSLMSAESELAGGALVAYSDILYDSEVPRSLLESDADIALAVDRDWRGVYVDREGHPEDEAELVRTLGDRVVEAGKGIPLTVAFGEFIGMLRLSAAGARTLCAVYREVLARDGLDMPFQRAKSLRTAYLTDMFQELAGRGVTVTAVPIRGRWMEIDVPGDLARARATWR
ncbi:MAG: phosphocholine cytidylyltransferase family protein [Candidatus Rokubacteria bacterium]|nr:phosphocholine cytidylyltransferase family protein [Candidatus Rokubacteria bacterium]